jgi:hypothetical protein
MLLFLLTAREDGLCDKAQLQATNSTGGCRPYCPAACAVLPGCLCRRVS